MDPTSFMQLPSSQSVQRQLQLGCDAVELLRDIEHVLLSSACLDGPWLPVPIVRQIQEMIDRADEVY